MSDKEELELEALRRQLDDAFETTRPRRGFDDELWVRLQARRPWWSRLRDSVAGFGGSVRDAPAVPVGVAAVVLIAVIGIGILGNGIRNNVDTSSGSSPAKLSEGGGVRPQSDSAYGGIPSARLNPGAGGISAPPQAVQGPGQPAPSNLYFGPANLTWAGNFSSPVPDAPVFRYLEPSFSQQHQAFGPYSADLNVSLSGSLPATPREPAWTVVATGSAVPAGSDPGTVADTFLATHNLLPAWPDEVRVQTSGNLARVQYLRGFQLTGGSVAYLVDGNGDRYGIEVDISPGRLVATGPLPLGLDVAAYRLITNDRAVQMAIQSPPAAPATLGSVPTVVLNDVQLVYSLVVSGPQGFYEPAYLFSGTFQQGGRTYTKRVLVPLVDPALRSS